jgi:Helix-turn-helix.
MSVGERFRQVRKKLSLTQTNLAEVLGCKQATIADYERDRISPSTKVLLIIAENYNLSIDWLLTGSGSMFLNQSNTEHCNNVPAHAREEIKVLEEEIKNLKKIIRDLQAECNELSDQNKELNTQLCLRLQELVSAKDALIKALS